MLMNCTRYITHLMMLHHLIIAHVMEGIVAPCHAVKVWATIPDYFKNGRCALIQWVEPLYLRFCAQCSMLLKTLLPILIMMTSM